MSTGPSQESLNRDLRSAAREGNITAIDLLILEGADPDSADDNGITALHLAVSEGHYDAVEVLLKRGAKADKSTFTGWSPLFYAVNNGDIRIAALLLDHGAEIDAITDRGGSTPLHLAAINGQAAMCRLLIKHGANVDLTDISDLNALDHAYTSEDEATISVILEKISLNASARLSARYRQVRKSRRAYAPRP